MGKTIKWNYDKLSIPLSTTQGKQHKVMQVCTELQTTGSNNAV